VSTPRSLRWPDTNVRHTVASDIGTLAAITSHADEPRGAVVLIHGFTGSKEDFATLAPALAAHGWTATAIDLPGQHESSIHDHVSIDAAVAAAAIRDAVAHAHTQTDDTVHLVGHSLGGLISRRAVLDHDARVASLTLLCSGPSAIADPASRVGLSQFVGAMQAGLNELVWSHLRSDRLVARPDLEDEILDWLERRFHDGDPRMHAALAQHLLDEVDLTDALVDHGVPVHVAFGEDDDVWPISDQVAMAERLGATTTRIPGTGHSPGVDDPDATAAALVQWWSGAVSR
jgi:pimeloyl-ACP methyl ester carboxylesterase